MMMSRALRACLHTPDRPGLLAWETALDQNALLRFERRRSRDPLVPYLDVPIRDRHVIDEGRTYFLPFDLRGAGAAAAAREEVRRRVPPAEMVMLWGCYFVLPFVVAGISPWVGDWVEGLGVPGADFIITGAAWMLAVYWVAERLLTWESEREVVLGRAQAAREWLHEVGTPVYVTEPLLWVDEFTAGWSAQEQREQYERLLAAAADPDKALECRNAAAMMRSTCEQRREEERLAQERRDGQIAEQRQEEALIAARKLLNPEAAPIAPVDTDPWGRSWVQDEPRESDQTS